MSKRGERSARERRVRKKMREKMSDQRDGERERVRKKLRTMRWLADEADHRCKS